MAKKTEKDFWYDISETLSYNCLFNFVIGSRGCGKTYAAKKHVVKRFLKTGKQFVYLRRYKDELDETAETYFNDIIYNKEFPNHKIEYKNGIYVIDGMVAGYAMALTKAKDYKSIAYPEVETIIFDEFLIEDNGYARYLKNEVKQFLNFYMSIDRYRGVTVFFLANSVALINPYTLYFDLSMPYGSDFLRKGDLLLQMVNNEAYIENRKQTRFGKMIEGTAFAEYAVENKFQDNNKTFIMKKTEKAMYFFTFLYEDCSYGVWIDYKVGKIFVSENVDPSCGVVYAITVEDHTPNTLLLNQLNRSPYFKRFIENYKMGNVYFESLKIKQVVYEIIKLSIN